MLFSKSPLKLSSKRRGEVADNRVAIEGVMKSIAAVYNQNPGGDRPVAVTKRYD